MVDAELLLATGPPASGGRLRARLVRARERTLAVVAPVSERDLDRVHDPLMSPLAWDLGHIAAFEDLWLCQLAGGLPALRPDLEEVYDAAETPRARRADAAFLGAAEALAFMASVRERSLAVLEEADLSAHADRLNAEGFVWDMVAEHEQQHTETMLQTLQLAEAGVYAPPRRALPPPRRVASGGGTGVRVDAGPFEMGANAAGFAYDNERPRHKVELPAFEMDRTPVTNAAYLAFVEDGGYQQREFWSDQGWDWRTRAGADRPLYWTADGRVRSFERTAALDPALPVMHVSWYEADAYARAEGKRLPTEAEWEKAASWGPGSAGPRRYAWGDDPPSRERANLDAAAFGPAPAGAFERGASAYGVLGVIGDAWEWTASDFTPYPGFSPFPYREYSETFFGGPYKVLRGGSWATSADVVRNTFRNWDLPERRQILSGFRCVRDL